MKILHYIFLVLVAIILSFCIIFSLIIASCCFNPSFFELVQSDNIELTSYNAWLIASFILAFTFISGFPPLFKKLINWFESQFDKLNNR